MPTSILWRGTLLVSTIIFLLYQVFETARVTSLARADQILSTKPSINDLPELTTPQKFSGTLKENNGWATRPLSEKGGLLWVQYNTTFEVTWGVSMFHSLHCIEMLRMALIGGPMPHSAMEESSTAPEEESDRDNNHLSHCLDYIAQSLICSGDSTLEPPVLKKDKFGYVVEQSVGGHGSIHMCKDTSHVWDLVEQSERKAVRAWIHTTGDTAQSVFG